MVLLLDGQNACLVRNIFEGVEMKTSRIKTTKRTWIFVPFPNGLLCFSSSRFRKVGWFDTSGGVTFITKPQTHFCQSKIKDNWGYVK